MKHIRLAAAIGAAGIAAAGLGAGAAITACGSSGQAPVATVTPGGSAYSYYRSMMGRLHGGSSPGSMMGGTSYAGTPGTYRYLCPVPGHVQKDMTGSFTVTSTT